MPSRLFVPIAAFGLLAACSTGYDDDPAPTGSAPAAEAGVPAMPAGLSRDEQIIWNSLNDQAKRDAAAFIANGGTLTQFVAV